MEPDSRTEVHKIAPDALQSQKLKRFFDYWLGLRIGHDLPRRHDIWPVDLGYLLGQVSLVQVIGAGREFYLRLIGTRIEELGRSGDQGKTVDQLRPACYRQLCRDAYQAVADQRHPLCFTISRNLGDRVIAYERMVLPVTVTGQSVELLIDALDWPPGSQCDLKRFRLLPSTNLPDAIALP